MDPNSDGGFMNSSDYEQLINDLKADSTFCDYKFTQAEIPFCKLTDYIKMEDVADSTDEHRLVITSSPTCTLPCKDPYPGPFNFEVALDSAMSSKKSWAYSELLQKVYIDMNKTLLVKFRLTAPAGSDLRVRALPVFSTADYVNQPVQRCTLHMLNNDPQHQAHSPDNKVCYCGSYNLVRHVVQSSHVNAIYDYDADSDRHSVIVPLDSPQPGSETVVVAYYFACKTSCPQGMQRRPISLVFTLETSLGDVVGRQCLQVKICSCPKRDKDREESDFPTSDQWSALDSCTRPKRKSSNFKYTTSKQIKLENNLQLKVMSHVENEMRSMSDNIRKLTETVNKVMETVTRMEDCQSKMIEALLQIMRQSSHK